MRFTTAVAVLGLACVAASAPIERRTGALEGVVDALGPVTNGVGTTAGALTGIGRTPISEKNNAGSDGTSSGSDRSESGAHSGHGKRAGALEGVVDAVAPITAGVGTAVNGLAGFGGASSGSSGSGQGGSESGSSNGGNGSGSGNGGNGFGSSGDINGLGMHHPSHGKRAGVLEGVVDAVAPITAGLGTTLNGLLGFQGASSGSPGSGQGGSGSGSGNGGNGSGSGNGGNGSGGQQGGSGSHGGSGPHGGW